MNLIDIFILVPLLYGLVRGLWRGFVKEVVATGALAVGIICAKLFSTPLSVYLQTVVTWDSQICNILAYALIFLAASTLLTMVGWLLSKLLSAIALGWLNHLLGAVLGLAKWALIVSLIINVVDWCDSSFHFIKPEQKATSMAYEPLRKVASAAWNALPADNLIDSFPSNINLLNDKSSADDATE